MNQNEYGFDTKALHAGFVPDKKTGSYAVPIYQTTAYRYESTDDVAAEMMLEKPGYIYTRLGNPTTEVLENRITALESGAGTVCFSSGMAAVMAAVQNIAESGSEIISSNTLYGGTHTLFFQRFQKRYGIKVVPVDQENFSEIEEAINEKTRCIYIESLGNPTLNIPDFSAITSIAHKHGLPVILDNTFATPYLFNAKKYGIDIVVHSLTKYMGGHGNSMGGSVTDLGTFDFKGNPRFEEMNTPDDSYHGIVYADLGQMGYTTKLRAAILRDTGSCLSPFNSFLLLLGIETLGLRMERHSSSALKLAEYLNSHEAISWVKYPGLKGDAFYERGKKYLNGGAGGVLSFGIKGGYKSACSFINSLELASLVVNVADSRSIVLHPASTTHSQLSEEDMITAGIDPGLVRFSVGLENAEDIIADIERSLDISQKL